MADVRLFNIVVLGISFMLIFTAFQTSSMVEEIVLKSVKNESLSKNETFSGDGYTSLAVIYAVFAASNWAAPSIVSVLGPKISMMAGGTLYCLFIASFLKPMTWALYTGSALVGIGAAVIWTAQGNFLTINSDSETVARNSGIFWALLQCSLLFGNLFVFFEFRGVTQIESHLRMIVYGALTVVCFMGILCVLILRNKRPTDSEDLVNLNASGNHDIRMGPLQALKRSLFLFKTREMILLSVCFAYTGFELTFFSGVYGACVGFTRHFGEDAKSLAGISGMAIGVGEILGGASFGLLGKKTNKYGRDPIVMLGYLVHMACFYLIFINLPDDSPAGETSTQTYLTSNKYIAILCSFLLGFGDSCFNTQIYSILGYMYPEDSAPAFALYKFVQSVTAAAGFFYSTALLLKWQLLILVVTGTMGSFCFFEVEWKASKATREGYQKI